MPFLLCSTPFQRRRSGYMQAPRCLSLAERVERALRANGYPALRTIEVSVEDRRVVLKGRIPSYYVKQMAQAVTLAVSEVQELSNEVEVIPTAALAPTGVEGRSFVFKFSSNGEKHREW
jgi:osmotically-inducible protein OsmY